MERVIGIDLGTTHARVATIESGVPMVIPSQAPLPGQAGQGLMPAMVAVTEQGKRLVGQMAKRQAILNAEHTAHSLKRLIGRKWSSQAVKQALEMVPFRVVSGPADEARVQLRGESFSVPELYAALLGELKRTAELYLHEPVAKAVLTVPATFSDTQRQAVKEAGRLAGLEVLRVVAEPTAAGIAFGIDVDRGDTKAQRVAVYDLGGGSFDFALLDLRAGVFEVRATAADPFLGGDDFDKRVLDWLIFGFAKDHKIDLRQDRTALQRLRDAVERAKCELSTQDEVTIEVPFIISTGTSEPLHLRRSLTRGKLEELTEDLVERTAQICRSALAEAGVDSHEIDAVILVGGMTRMPRVQVAVQELFGRAPLTGPSPEDAVAIGAALQGAALTREAPSLPQEHGVQQALGLLVSGGAGSGLCFKLVEAGAELPCERRHVFTTARDSQTGLKILVFEGNAERAADNDLLGEFVLDGLRPAARGEIEVEVCFRVSEDGMLSVTATDLETQQTRSMVLSPSDPGTGSLGGSGEGELTQMLVSAGSYTLEMQKDDEFFRAQQRTERLISEILGLLPRAELVVGGSDLGLDAIRRARAAVERAKIAIIRGEPVALLDAQEVLQRTALMLRGVTASLRAS